MDTSENLTVAETQELGSPQLTTAEREYLRAQISHAAESIAPNWPIKTFISRSPLSGFEYMHFDMAVRRSEELTGGKGYLTKEEYRRAYHEGRITTAELKRAINLIWPSNGNKSVLTIQNREIQSCDIVLLHLVHGIDALIPELYQWKVKQEGATQNFRPDIPLEAQQRIISQSRDRLQESLNRIGTEMTISEWVYRYTGLNLPHFIHDLLKQEQPVSSANGRSTSVGTDETMSHSESQDVQDTTKIHKRLTNLGLEPQQFEGYQECLKKQFQEFQSQVEGKSVDFSDYRNMWLAYEEGALQDVVAYLCGKAGNLVTLQNSVRDTPEHLHLKGLWVTVLRIFGLVDPDLPDRLGDLLTQPASPKIRTSKEPPDPLSLGFIHSMATWVSRLSGEEVVEKINEEMIRWCSAFVDEGQSSWSMPGREQGFYLAWRNLAALDSIGQFLGVFQTSQSILSLPDQPEDAIVYSLNRMGIPKDQWEEYLTRHLAHLPGWVGYIRWRSNEPEYSWQKRQPINPVEYLAVRLFYEAEFVKTVCQREWDIEGTLPALESYFQQHWRSRQASLGQSHSPTHENLEKVCHEAWRLFELAQFLELFPEDLQALSGTSVEMLFEWLNQFPDDRQGLIWQEAYEEHFRIRLLSKLRPDRSPNPNTPSPSSPKNERPQAQAVFCIDVRSEPLRRHLESQGNFDTIGFAGFFGIPICYRPMESDEDQLLCPVLLKPKNTVREGPRNETRETTQKFDVGLKWNHFGHHLFHDLKSHPIASFMLIDILGALYAITLVGKTLLPTWFRGFTDWVKRQIRPSVPSRIPVENLSQEEAEERLAYQERIKLKQFLNRSPAWNQLGPKLSDKILESIRQAGLAFTPGKHVNPGAGVLPSLEKELALSSEQYEILVQNVHEELKLKGDSRDAQLDWFSIQGFTPAEQAFNIERCLKVMSLIENFARLVLVCGHGSTTENNPYAAGYDCGACGGNHGGPNARVLAAMANKPEVRAELKNRGIHIPEDTWFLPGEHNTTIDHITFFDLEDLPETHKPDVARLQADLKNAGIGLAEERCRRLPGTPSNLPASSAKAHTATRSVDWSQVRPEWGLASNAAFIIAKRSISKGVNLEGRTFLHNYHAEQDEDGKVLETIMTAPMVVAEWINLQYYFSTVDPWVYGSGSKVLHNVVSGVGVMSGSHSDFQSGLPLQTVRDGNKLFHEPLRLLVIIQAPISRIMEIVERHTILQYFFNNQWIHLVALDPTTAEFRQYIPGGTWNTVELPDPSAVGDPS